MAEIRVPKLNTNDSAYVLLEWLVADGAPVRGEDVVAAVETSKTVEELVSGHDGILVQLIPAGADCTPGQPIAHITPHPAPTTTPPMLATPPPTPVPPTPVAPTLATPPPAPVFDGVPAAGAPATVPGGAPVSGAPATGSGDAVPSKAPLITAPAQALIDELGIDPARVRALPVKVVRRVDVERLAAAGSPSPRLPAPPAADGPSLPAKAAAASPAVVPPAITPPPPTVVPHAVAPPVVAPPGETPSAAVPPAVAPVTAPASAASAVASPGAVTAPVVPVGGSVRGLSGNQRAVGRTVSLSHQTIPAAYTAIKVDVGKATAAARDLTKRLRKLVGLPDLLIAAVARLHHDFPLCFATLLDENTAAVPDAPNVGVTIDLGTGLYVPVIRDAHTKGIEEIAGELAGFRRLAQRGGFRQEHFDGGNIVVTLHHDRDIVMAVPIVFPGQACALALTSPQREGERTVAVIGLAYDHRLVNGRDAVLFLQALKETLEAASFEGL
ncbi:2-oxo acid dehydrogenase subunit E2 [Nonomuraea jabiensis]|uniref:Dihydrolipoamide acetyltransferase component of pyruvate dehydrogenase complex n=1 Tax=Nonomuraea jabiensis TaxID=882448 RepID=A0A7W9GBG4_9ACTN|nr:2-oxo acid dehydrogenase subunit E2 [Nonomuraea jabiensis]MBB5780727.1 2-oxoglutarate dehydrogenase E2 component (dihydrolipoamide succinyltransferase) [Nonomuraea jabiensis]